MLLAKSWKFLVPVVLVIGIILRLLNLDANVYSADEVRAIMRWSGSTNQQLIEEMFDGEIRSVEDLQNYQKPIPQNNLSDTINALVGNPEHPPLYPLLSRFWMQLFNTPIAARYLSILFSLLVFPCIYWLCLELFESSVVGLVAICLVSVSPLHILAAQNTTQYSLWMITILLSSAGLLRALKLNTLNLWIGYAVFAAMGFYTHLYFATVALSHGLYVLITEKFQLTRKFLTYILASIGSLILFSPWIYVIVTSLETIKANTTYYSSRQTTFSAILYRFRDNIINIFIDFHNRTRLENFYLGYLVLGLVVFSLYFICRFTPLKTWLFIILLILCNALFYIIPDSFGASIRSMQYRYYIPSFLAIQLSVSYLLAHYINNLSLKFWQRQLWQMIFLGILLVGIVSDYFIAQDRDWGLDDQKGTASSQNLTIVSPINQSERPLVLTATTPSFILALSHLTDSEVKFRLFHEKNSTPWTENLALSNDANKFSDIFIIYPNDKLVNLIEQTQPFQLKQVIPNKVYKLEPKEVEN